MKKTVLIFITVILMVLPVFFSAAADASGVSAEMKEFCDAYEAFYDKNIEIIKKYLQNPNDVSLSNSEELLKDFSQIRDKAMDYEKKSANVIAGTSEEMSLEDAKYFLEVNGRVVKKLADAGITESGTGNETSNTENAAETSNTENTADTSKSTSVAGAPQTFDAGIVIAVSAMAVSAGAVFSLKRRK